MPCHTFHPIPSQDTTNIDWVLLGIPVPQIPTVPVATWTCKKATAQKANTVIWLLPMSTKQLSRHDSYQQVSRCTRWYTRSFKFLIKYYLTFLRRWTGEFQSRQGGLPKTRAAVARSDHRHLCVVVLHHVVLCTLPVVVVRSNKGDSQQPITQHTMINCSWWWGAFGSGHGWFGAVGWWKSWWCSETAIEVKEAAHISILLWKWWAMVESFLSYPSAK